MGRNEEGAGAAHQRERKQGPSTVELGHRKIAAGEDGHRREEFARGAERSERTERKSVASGSARAGGRFFKRVMGAPDSL
jgi:hypothetical protein